ncbi:InlB B-repeat-containing protein [Desulfonatronum thioautotrophicum]|uniref:InlB B-repeat-containing protein n=1 Tax=Desulfonatronum thioautotrophicum TaxID=617001 RepID=UPI00129476C3|nr:hypothetical protein [Desulfonatronum thioautotrophicum]
MKVKYYFFYLIILFIILFSTNSFCQTYTVTPIVEGNGTISPNNEQFVIHGETVEYIFRADSGYRVDINQDCGGYSLSRTNNFYRFNSVPITKNCNIEVKFVPDVFIVTPIFTKNGVVEPSTPQEIKYSILNFTVKPDEGYSASVGGTCGGVLSGNRYTTNIITSDCSVEVDFIRNIYNVTPSVGANGGMSPSTIQTISHGETLTFIMTPDEGYSASVGGTCVGTLEGDTLSTGQKFCNCQKFFHFYQ